jgi:hypothetical protein
MIRRLLAGAAVLIAAVGLWLVAAHVPSLLLFPHHRMVGDTPVYSAAPITPAMESVLRDADARLRTSPLYRP